MTVRELIEQLQECHPDDHVRLEVHEEAEQRPGGLRISDALAVEKRGANMTVYVTGVRL